MFMGLLVSACGGGGGGDGGSGDGGGGSGGGSASTGPGSAQILFPWIQSAAVGNTLTVRGIASDPDGVAAVQVNIVVDGFVISSGGLTKPTRPTSVSKAADIDAETEEGVEWSVEVDLETGDNNIEVVVEDDTGDVTGDVNEATVSYTEVPGQFASDVGDPRVFGWSTSPSRFGDVTRFVGFDYRSGELSVYPGMQEVGPATCLRGQAEEFIYLFQTGDPAEFDVRRLHLDTGVTTVAASIPPALLEPGPGFSSGPLQMQLACSSAHDKIYLLASYWEGGDPARSVILEIDQAGNSSVLTETDPDELPLWTATRMSLSGESIVTLHDVQAIRPLTEVLLADGSRNVLAPAINVGGLAIAAVLDQDRVFVTTFEGVDLIHPSVPDIQNISPASPTETLVFSQANSIDVDLVGDRVIVGDSDLNLLIGVDIPTGARSEVLSRKIGAGVSLITPRRLALTADGATLYVLDDGSNAPERLFEVDLETGDRRVIGQIHEVGINRGMTGLALDEESGYAYVSRFDAGTILRVDLETEAVEAITSSSDGLLENVSDILLDLPNQRLLAVDTSTDAIVAIDTVTLQKDLISRDGDRGMGPAFATPTSITMTPDGTLYVTDQATNEIISVDPETGDRMVYETTCSFTTPESLSRAIYLEDTNDFLIRADGVFAVNRETSVCLPAAGQRFPLDVVVTPEGQILAAEFNAVLQIDRPTGDLVIVSR